MLRGIRYSSVIFCLIFFFFFFAKNIYAECTGQFPEYSSCTPECTALYKKVTSWYDCPPNSAINPDTGKPDCRPDQRIFNCSFPLWYDDPGCTNQIGYNPCASACGANGTGSCTGGNQNCQCGIGAVCVSPDSNYSAYQLCTGNYQETQSNGGCLSVNCGYFCWGKNTTSAQCLTSDPPSLSPEQQQQYASRGAQNLQQCQTDCQQCQPNSWDSNYCKSCNSTGQWNGGDGSDWGTVGGNVTQAQWCNCAQRYGSNYGRPYSSTNYPQCFDATPAPVVCNNNGVQDNGETGIDCGGSVCPACSSTAPTPTSCPGSCGDSNYGLLPSCQGNWGYAANSSYDAACQQTYGGAKSYCYTCTTTPTGGSTPPNGCTPGQTTNACRADFCTPGTIGNP